MNAVKKISCAAVWCAVLLCCGFQAYANNIAVANGAFGTHNSANKTLVIQFDISWENSWRVSAAPNNHDAAWVFIKYSMDGGSTWGHATLKAGGVNPAGFSRGAGTLVDIIVPADKKGAFIQRSADGAGSVSTTGMQIVWDYAADGVSDANASVAAAKVMAIEMVYIPAGAYSLGDGGGFAESSYAFHETDNNFVTISQNLQRHVKVDPNNYDDNQLEGAGVGIDGDAGLDSNDDGVIDNAGLPTGYNAFYMMKYEISQAQYRDFLNCLTAGQKAARCSAVTAGRFACNVDTMASPQNRNSVQRQAGGYVCNLDNDSDYNEAADGEAIAYNWLSWEDLAAYADWAALRPMTELEFEKACVGSGGPVLYAYAWNDITIFNQAYILVNTGTPGEAVQNQPSNMGNAVYSTTDGGIFAPLRCGIFAAAGTSKHASGASYYGVMELSGNLVERAVTLGLPEGRNFDGQHGDGVLSAAGNATAVPKWPGAFNGEVTGATGAGFRGGSWFNTFPYCHIADRTNAAVTVSTRYSYVGGRAVRSEQ